MRQFSLKYRAQATPALFPLLINTHFAIKSPRFFFLSDKCTFF